MDQEDSLLHNLLSLIKTSDHPMNRHTGLSLHSDMEAVIRYSTKAVNEGRLNQKQL